MAAYVSQLFAIEKTWYAKSTRSTRLHVFVEAMESFAAQQGLLVCAYTLRKVKKMMCGHGNATRLDLAETLIRQRYHFLAPICRGTCAPATNTGRACLMQ